MNVLLQDLRFALRMAARQPAFALTATAILALGIGANTAMFSVVNGVLIEPLPYPGSDRIAALWMSAEREGLDRFPMTHAHFDVYRQADSFEKSAVYWRTSVTLTGVESPQRLTTGYVSQQFFEVLGVTPAMGRGFVAGEDARDPAQVAVLGDGLWRRVFGADPEIVGKAVRLDGRSVTIVGVAPQGFEFPADVELWQPIGVDPSQAGAYFLRFIARLKAGVSPVQAKAETDQLGRQFALSRPDVHPDGPDFVSVVIPLKEEITGEVSGSLWMLFAAVGCVLLITCANVGGLLLARSSRRAREISVRRAIGAGRWRIVRQFLTESLLLAMLGGLGGLAAASLLIPAIVSAAPAGLPRLGEIAMQPKTVVFTAAVALLAAVAFGAAPAWRIQERGLREALQRSTANVAFGSRSRANAAAIIAQFALTLVLVWGGGLLLRSFQKAAASDPGFRSTGVLTLRLSLPRASYPERADVEAFYRDLLPRLRALPGVREAGATDQIPLTNSNNQTDYAPEGAETGERLIAGIRFASPGYFEAMGYRLLAGRFFDSQDGGANAQRLVVVDRKIAERHFTTESALGKRITFSSPGEEPEWSTIVGVVESVKHHGLDVDAQGMIYQPQSPVRARTTSLAIASASDPAELAAAVRSKVSELDSELPVYSIATIEELVSDALAQRRFTVNLLTGFGAFAALLASIGIYGVMSQSVAARVREIGMRQALGARRSDVLRLFVGDGLRLAATGLAIGAAATLLVGRVVKTSLYETPAHDPITLGAAAALLGVVALASVYLPARRAALLEPTAALREQ